MAKKKPIVSPLGQWAYPGEVTIIPSSNITMKGVNYPVLGVDDLGNQQMMMPGQDYTFPGDYVTEIPQMGKGGLTQWFAEKWTDVKTGKPCGRSGKEKGSRPYPACRPKNRVNETTPKTTSEMSSAEKAKFKREKTSGKRIDYNHKRREDGGETWLDQYQDGGIETSSFLNPDRISEVYIKPKNPINRFFSSFSIPNMREQNYDIEDAAEDYEFTKKIDFSEIPTDRNFSNPDFEDAYNWTKKYMSSPRYRDMLQGKDEDSQIEVSRAYNLLTIPTELNRLTDEEISRGIGGYSSSITGDITVNPLSSPNFFKNEVLPHEISHSVDRPKSNVSWARLIPEQDTAEISKRIRKNPNVESIGSWQDHGNTPEEGTINYYSDPTEVRARLNSTRKFLNKEFGVDVFNDKIKYKDLRKLNLFINDNPDGHTDYEDLKSLYHDDDILWLLNNVSKTEQPKLNIAKYGGWLDQFQTGGWAGWTPNVGKPYMRTSPAGNAGYTDNTRVVTQNTNVSAANRKAAEAAEYAKRVGSISQGKTKSAYEKAKEASSLVAQAQQRKGSADPLDYVLDMVNPATYGFAGVDLVGNTAMGVNNLAKANFSEAAGNVFDAGMNALYLAPAVAELSGPLYRGIPKAFVNKSKVELERQAAVDWLKNWYGQPEIKQRFNQQIYNPAIADDLVMPIYKKNVLTDIIEKPKSTINLDKSAASDFASTMSKEKYAELKYGFKNDPIISLKYGEDIPATHKKYLGVNSGFGNNMGGYTNVYPEHPAFFYNKFNPNSQWKPTVKGTSIHEGTHWLTTGDEGLAESTKAMFKEPFDFSKRISKHDKYLTKPTEIHARLNELRSQYNLGPTVTQSQVDKIIADGLKGNTTVQKRFFELLKDNKSLTNLFNTAMGISTPIIASQLPEQKNGGWLNKYK